MEIDELLTRFDSLYEKFHIMQNEYTEQLRNLLIEFNGGSIEYKLDNGTTIKLNEAPIAQMKAIIENIRNQRNIEKRIQIQSSIREQQTGRSTYGPNNEYGK